MIEFIESLYWRKDLTKRKDEVLSWLKSIKDRVQPKQEWSEEDEKIYSLIYSAIKNDTQIASPSNKKDAIDWLKSLKDRVQPKQEWSEEDEKRVNSIISSIEYCSEQYPDRKEYAKDINWLKSLNPQSKLEWSEEDEKMCQETIDWFEKKCFPYALEYENPARESIKWLKSLKSKKYWKPSDEQISELGKAAILQNVRFNKSILESLYNDLKRL